MALIAPRLRDDQAEVRVDHLLLRLEVAALDALRELDLLGRRQQGVLTGASQEQRERVRRTGRLERGAGRDELGGVRSAPSRLPLVGTCGLAATPARALG
jgi:hypothetical protein